MLPNNLEDLTDHELQRLKTMIDIAKIQADIEMTRQSVNESQKRLDKDLEESRERMEESRKRLEKDLEESRQRMEESRINTAKLTKELAWYPWLQIATTLLTGILTGGFVVFLLGKVL
ncbi:hypothetical protein MOMA_09241 [Moraxella macacae 0408225]|uniref:Uncharacterized protein n=1 Tax=Moraxella macacae 0408225 TaxID=1230338 RepID=L2F6R4_9GAMM|nr:hypothetical protein [Moraxella macacae]ELA08732.1 hypothetical protein MOMA_09241 [Moraxella macacae 0408225]